MKNFIILIVLLLAFQTHAQQIYPIPQRMESQGKVPYAGVRSSLPDLSLYHNKSGIKLKESIQKGVPAEGYSLTITPKQIHIVYSTERGRFYALKTLVQLLNQAQLVGELPLVKITDSPDIPFRGTVEGFYGQPWSHVDRIAQLRFYGDWKLNTYIYGPKDDPYHSSPKWREPYPAAEAARLSELVQEAKENHVDFYWAIHPGLDIKWNKADSTAVLHKFEWMYDLGVRHFAVFFDDISGEGTKAEKQAGLLNYLQKEFIDKRKDVGALIMCPTEYNKGWSNPKEGTYLDILGDQLDPRIHVMWTGNTVIHDITLEGQQWVNKRIKRPSFVWWNFPVSDYVRNHLLLGEAYGLDKNAKLEMAGFVSNPMDKPEASKVAIFSIANYAWNLKAYDPAKTWEDVIDLLYPDMAKSYKLFSSHNTDPGPSYHQYRRAESQKIAAILEKQTNSLIEGKSTVLASSDIELLRNEFLAFISSADEILSNSNYGTLITEIRPWLQYFAVEGQAALVLLSMNQEQNPDKLYTLFGQFQLLRDQMIAIDQKENRNPYQPGIVTASRYVLPWIEQSNIYYHTLLKSEGYPVKDAVNQPKASMYTNIEMLRSLPIQNDVWTGNRPFQVLKLGKMLEFIPFKPQDYVGVEITSSSRVREVRYKLDKKVEGFEVQYSADGKTWVTKKDPQIKYVRLINNSNQTTAVKIEQFEVIFE